MSDLTIWYTDNNVAGWSSTYPYGYRYYVQFSNPDERKEFRKGGRSLGEFVSARMVFIRGARNTGSKYLLWTPDKPSEYKEMDSAPEGITAFLVEGQDLETISLVNLRGEV